MPTCTRTHTRTHTHTHVYTHTHTHTHTHTVCGLNVHKRCERMVPCNCGINQKELSAALKEMGVTPDKLKAKASVSLTMAPS